MASSSRLALNVVERTRAEIAKRWPANAGPSAARPT
jgi:hypothetical protein